jgi:hypothetical protein
MSTDRVEFGRMAGMTGRPPAPRAAAARVPVAVAEVVGFTWLAHVAAGGATPGTGHLLAVAAAVGLVAVALRHRLVRLPVAVAGAVLAQVGLHLAFTHATGMPMHGEHVLASLDGGMLLAHAVAAVVTALALAWQEQVVVRLAGRLLPRLVAAPPARPARVAATAVRPRPAASLRHVAAAPRRGPPVVVPA